jgi:hypothetical protein
MVAALLRRVDDLTDEHQGPHPRAIANSVRLRRDYPTSPTQGSISQPPKSVGALRTMDTWPIDAVP